MAGSKQNDVNGVACHACARHGCYCLGSMVDILEGEKQSLIDYSRSEMMKTINMDRMRKLLAIYDIMCQYYKKLDVRFSRNNMLNMRSDVIYEKAIGQFHVHGHKDTCFFRFSSSFIPGAGQVDGEVLETLWGTLNKISWSARTTTLAHRTEILDDHTNDSNWKKLVNIGEHNFWAANPHMTNDASYDGDHQVSSGSI